MNQKQFDKLLKNILRRIVFSGPVKKGINYTKRVALPGFDNIPIYDVADFFFTGIQRGSIVMRAQSLAFSFFLAIFPAIIFLFSLIAYVPIDGIQDDVMLLVQQLLPKEAFKWAKQTIEDIINIQRGGLLSFGFVLALYFTTNGFMTMMRGFNSSYHIAENRSPWQQRKTAIILTLLLTTLTVIATTIIIFSEKSIHFLAAKHILKSKTQIGMLLVGKWVVVLALFFFAISFLYYYAPAVKKRWRFISPGSTFATLLSILFSTAFAYFVNNFGSYNKVYGSIGTIIVIMLWMYFNSMSLILGFELNASIDIAKRQLKKVF
jgi:membrane protein